MTPELTVLTLAGLLQVAQYAAMAIPANLELGPGKTMGPRDAARPFVRSECYQSTARGDASAVPSAPAATGHEPGLQI
jgi:hypothetical protein